MCDVAKRWTVHYDSCVLAEERRRNGLTVEEQARRMRLHRVDLYRALHDRLPNNSDKKSRFDSYIARLMREYFGAPPPPPRLWELWPVNRDPARYRCLRRCVARYAAP
jgi:hypothetical protein